MIFFVLIFHHIRLFRRYHYPFDFSLQSEPLRFLSLILVETTKKIKARISKHLTSYVSINVFGQDSLSCFDVHSFIDLVNFFLELNKISEQSFVRVSPNLLLSSFGDYI